MSSYLKNNASAIVDVSCNDSSLSGDSHYDITQIRHIGTRPIWHSPPIEEAAAKRATTVILTGSGEAFRDIEPALDFLQRVKPKYIIHHMTRPLASGRLWDIIRNGPLVRDGIPNPDHLAVIIDADDLRAEGIALSRSLSWEATAEDFVRNLGSNGRLDTLVTCPNLIVRFGNQGCVLHRGRDAADPKLYFHPRQMEQSGEHMVSICCLSKQSPVNVVANSAQIGLASAFTAGFAMGFPDSDKGIKLGMAAAHRLAHKGFVENPEDDAPDYPVQAIMESLTPLKPLTTVNVPSSSISSGDSFSTFDALTGDVSEVARQIITKGPEDALARCSIRRFGDLLSVERSEQESLGSIVDTMHERLESGNVLPTCIGISGPIGSGKKFIATNIVETVGAKQSIQKMTINAGNMETSDLVNACQAIRDNAADNHLTMIFFENFETVLKPANSKLFQHFDSLMRYGTFRDDGRERTAGRCLLVFLVNQDPPIMEAAPTPTHSEFRERREIDDTAFRANLHGTVSVLGPNQAGPQDKLFAVRRALMIRQLLQETHPQVIVRGKMKMDEAVLNALLFVPRYNQALRSITKLVSISRLTGKTKFDVAALPPEEQIQSHTDGPTFMAYLRAPKLPAVLRERLAEGLFEAYKKQRILMAETPDQKRELKNDRAMVDWEDLPGELKESTRAQADDIPRKLRAVDCFMQDRPREDPLVRVTSFGAEELLMLSEMEHERFNAERLQRQWRMGPRNSKQRTTPFLVPWRDLSQEWKDVDRVMVEVAPKVIDDAGYYIYRMKKDDEDE